MTLALSTIAPPVLKSPLGEEVVKFSIAYQQYACQVETVNAGLPTARRSNPVGYKACIQPELLESLAFMGKFGDVESADEVTENSVKEWVIGRTRCSAQDAYKHVEDALTRVKHKPSSSDPEGAAMVFFSSVITELRRNRVDGALKDSVKPLISSLIPKLEPPSLRKEMEKAYEFWPSEKKADFKFFQAEVARLASKHSLLAPSFQARKEKSKDTQVARLDKPLGKVKKEARRGKKRAWNTKCLNPKCGEYHPVMTCPNTPEAQKKELLDKYRSESKKQKPAGKAARKSTRVSPGPRKRGERLRDGAYKLTFPGAVVAEGIGDYGADNSSLPKSVWDEMCAAGSKPIFEKFDKPLVLRAAIELPDGVDFTASGKTRLNIIISLPCGPLSIRNV